MRTLDSDDVFTPIEVGLFGTFVGKKRPLKEGAGRETSWMFGGVSLNM